jgi:ferric-dicitrate binding protein FerR (iron transport regulator)
MTHSPDEPIAAMALERYLSGEGSSAERARVERWLRAEPERLRTVTLLKARLEHSIATAHSDDAEWQRFSAKCFANPRTERPNVAIPSRRLRSRLGEWRPIVRMGLVATSAVCMIGVGMLWLNGRDATRHDTPQVTTRSYATAANERATITLSDGSRVTLGASTRLVVAHDPNSGDATRVQLDGQAIFTVENRRHTAARTTLIVRTERAETRVLGTTFLVRQYAGEHATRVVVKEGRVTVRASSARRRNETGAVPGAVLSAGALGVVSDSGAVRVTQSISPDDYMAWTKAALVFRQTPVRDVLAQVGRAYDVEIRLRDSTLAQRPMTWNVAANQSLADVLEEFPILLDVRIARTGRLITLLPGRRTSQRRVGPHSPSSLLSTESQHGK